MRFAQLDLLAYGHFTDRRLAFTRGETDLQLVFGANEAGKSTARSAVNGRLRWARVWNARAMHDRAVPAV